MDRSFFPRGTRMGVKRRKPPFKVYTLSEVSSDEFGKIIYHVRFELGFDDVDARLVYAFRVDYLAAGRYRMAVGMSKGGIPRMPELRCRIRDTKLLHLPDVAHKLGKVLYYKDANDGAAVSSFRSRRSKRWGSTRCHWMAHTFVDVASCDWFFRGGKGW